MNFKKAEGAPFTVRAYNPICGDRFEFYPEVSRGKITALHFHGYGCAVSMASGSVLVKLLSGKDIDEALSICNSYFDFLHQQQNDQEVPEEFLAFKAVRDFPARYDCAAMAWKEVKNFLLNRGDYTN